MKEKKIRYKCECGARISALKGLYANRSTVFHLGRMLLVRGACSRCGKRYCFLPEVTGPDSPNNRHVNKFARFLADKYWKRIAWHEQLLEKNVIKT